MESSEGRDRICEIRARLSDAMRAVSRPEPDWKAAEEAASECVRMCAELETRCWHEGWKERHGYR